MTNNQEPLKIDTITILGANGTMGANVAGIFAAFGSAKVYMVSRTLDRAASAIERAVSSVRADSIRNRLIPADYSMLEQCIRESDLVFETVAEDFQVKCDIYQKIAPYLRSDTIVASGTSGLSIKDFTETLPEINRASYVGMHFFNPPYQLVLCELIPTHYTSPVLLLGLKNYLEKTLLRAVVEVADSPAFLGNRIGFLFMNDALLYAEKYRHSGGIDYIDAILGPFTGRGMAPLNTIDFVGLDIHKAIIANIRENVNEGLPSYFELPGYFEDLLHDGQLGRKTHGGLYKTQLIEDGKKQKLVYDICDAQYRIKRKYTFSYAEQMKSLIHDGNYKDAVRELIENDSQEARLCLAFLLRYIAYALYAAKQVNGTLAAADTVMAEGFNWCPPLAMLDLFSQVVNVSKLMEERLETEFLEATGIQSLLKEATPSKYDYRRYFRSAN